MKAFLKKKLPANSDFHVYAPAALYELDTPLRIPKELFLVNIPDSVKPITRFVRISMGYNHNDFHQLFPKCMAFYAMSDGKLYGNFMLNEKERTYIKRMTLNEAEIKTSQSYTPDHGECLKKIGYELNSEDNFSAKVWEQYKIFKIKLIIRNQIYKKCPCSFCTTSIHNFIHRFGNEPKIR